MKYYITFMYANNGHNDRIVACVEGKHVQRWWGKHKLPDVELLREYSLNYISNLHPLDIQQGVFLTAGMEAGNISELKIFQSEKSFEELFK